MSAPQTRAGFVAVVGAPNAGKSTLVNALVGQKVAIVSPKAQTTRARLMGIAIHEGAQILLVDTPGIFRIAKRRLERAMVAAAWQGAEDADVLALVVDAERGVGQEGQPQDDQELLDQGSSWRGSGRRGGERPPTFGFVRGRRHGRGLGLHRGPTVRARHESGARIT